MKFEDTFNPKKNHFWRISAFVLLIAYCMALPGIAQQSTIHHSYPKGWNLVSVPIIPIDPSPSSVFNAVPPPLRLYDYKNGFEVEACESGFTNIVPGHGYRLLLGQSTNVSVSGTLVSDSNSYHIPLMPGWNVIGSPWQSSINWDDSRISISDGIQTKSLHDAALPPNPWIEGNLYSMNPATEVYSIMPANAVPPNKIFAWQGYLLFAFIQGELIVSIPPEDTVYPIAQITAPANDAKISLITDITGTAYDDNLSSWTLEYAPAETRQYTVLATGNTPISNGLLGKLDPTILVNGMVNLRLTAVDLAGHESQDMKTVIIEGENKLGVMRITLTDLDVPLSGIPITIKRTYDSRVRNIPRDFGYGWSLEVGVGGKYVNNIPPGWGMYFNPSGPLLCYGGAQSEYFHATEIRFSDTEHYRFALQYNNPQPQGNGCIAQAQYVQIGGKKGATLQVTGNNSDTVFWPFGYPYLFDLEHPTGAYEPSEVILTTREGMKYHMKLQGGLYKASDLNGNELTIASDGVTHSNGQSIAFTRDTVGRIISIVDPTNKTLSYVYTAGGDLDSMTNRENKTVRYTYANHFLMSMIDAENNTPMTMEYYPDGRVKAIIDAAGHRTELEHDPEVTNSSTITSRLGKPTRFKYDFWGHLSDIIAPGNLVTHFDNDLKGNVLSATDPMGHTTYYKYDEYDNVTEIKDPLDHITTNIYNGKNSLASTTNPLNKPTYYTRDAVNNNLLSITDPMNNVTSYTYYPNGKKWTETDALNHVTTYEYDINGNLKKATDALNNAVDYVYDTNGRMQTKTVHRTVDNILKDETTIMTYDNEGHMLTMTDALGNTTTYTYNDNGKQQTVTDALGRVTTYKYDIWDRLWKIYYPDNTPGTLDDNPVEVYGYDNEGREISFTDREGHETRKEYDDLGRLIKTIYPKNNPLDPNEPVPLVQQQYDNAGNVRFVTNERGYQTEYQYDDANRRIKSTDAKNKITSYEYYDDGNLKSVTDANANTTNFQYDDNGRRTQIIDPAQHIKETTYDELGRRIEAIDEEGNSTCYGYDAASRLTSVTDALGKITTYSFDEVGNRIAQTDANNHTTSFIYDALGRNVKRTLPKGM